mmetsp:Transcript_20184/g.47139  ORF Transcript_20184/g.47139 Transcript_20184/m.47139 type:complete len:298 (-) Transcript_20184:34-927(-)
MVRSWMKALKKEYNSLSLDSDSARAAPRSLASGCGFSLRSCTSKRFRAKANEVDGRVTVRLQAKLAIAVNSESRTMMHCMNGCTLTLAKIAMTRKSSSQASDGIPKKPTFHQNGRKSMPSCPMEVVVSALKLFSASLPSNSSTRFPSVAFTTKGADASSKQGTPVCRSFTTGWFHVHFRMRWGLCVVIIALPFTRVKSEMCIQKRQLVNRRYQHAQTVRRNTALKTIATGSFWHCRRCMSDVITQNVPAHLSQELWPGPEIMPDSHGLHRLSKFPFFVPGGHSTHSAAPEDAANRPA